MDILLPYLQPLAESAQILHLGSGTSDLHNHLRQHGFLSVTNMDYESLALERGRQLERERFGDVRTKYVIADATRLKMADRYQVVIDKSTADAIGCGEGDAIMLLAKGLHRCLDGTGFWISLSYSPSRFDHVQSLFEVEVISRLLTPKSKPTDPDVFHYCYLLRPRR